MTKTVKTGTTTDYVQHYVGGIEYNSIAGANRRIESIYHMEGRYFNTNTGTTSPTYRTEYTIKDHLDIVRVTFTDLNANGKIDATNNAATNEIIQENHYYAFGLNHEGPWLMNKAATDNAYQYNGKELNLDHGLNWSDYGARWYDATIGRWTSIDPLREKFSPSTGYAYAINNPVKFLDPDGMDVWKDVDKLKAKVDSRNAKEKAEAERKAETEEWLSSSRTGEFNLDNKNFNNKQINTSAIERDNPKKPGKALNSESTYSDILNWAGWYLSIGDAIKSSELVKLAGKRVKSQFIKNEIGLIGKQIAILQKGGNIVSGAGIALMIYRVANDKEYTDREFAYDASTTITATTLGYMATLAWAGPYGWAAGAVVGVGVGVFFEYVKPKFDK